MHFLWNGKPCGPLLSVPPQFTALRPYAVSRHPSTVILDLDGSIALAASHVASPKSLFQHIGLEKRGRLLRRFLQEGFTLGAIEPRWRRHGLGVIPASRPSTWLVQRTDLPAFRRHPFVTAFVPGVCLSQGHMGFEVNISSAGGTFVWSHPCAR